MSGPRVATRKWQTAHKHTRPLEEESPEGLQIPSRQTRAHADYCLLETAKCSYIVVLAFVTTRPNYSSSCHLCPPASKTGLCSRSVRLLQLWISQWKALSSMISSSMGVNSLFAISSTCQIILLVQPSPKDGLSGQTYNHRSLKVQERVRLRSWAYRSHRVFHYQYQTCCRPIRPEKQQKKAKGLVTQVYPFSQKHAVKNKVHTV